MRLSPRCLLPNAVGSLLPLPWFTPAATMRYVTGILAKTVTITLSSLALRSFVVCVYIVTGVSWAPLPTATASGALHSFEHSLSQGGPGPADPFFSWVGETTPFCLSRMHAPSAMPANGQGGQSRLHACS